jgi:hypothetical protein
MSKRNKPEEPGWLRVLALALQSLKGLGLELS